MLSKHKFGNSKTHNLELYLAPFAGWREHIIKLQITLQSYSNKYNMVLSQNRYADQCKRTEDIEMNPESYSHQLFNKTYIGQRISNK